MRTRFGRFVRLTFVLGYAVGMGAWQVSAQVVGYTYTTNNGAIIITSYMGPGGVVAVPSTINGLPVTSISYQTFAYCTSLTSLTIPNSVTSIGDWAFYSCTSLTNVTIPSIVTNIWSYAFNSCSRLSAVYFQGDAPNLGDLVFVGDFYATVYYIPGTTGWSATFGGVPTAPWKPRMENRDESFGVRSNQFGFNIAWADGRTVVVEASAALTNPTWSPVSTNTLTDGSSFFSEPLWPKYSARFYRLRTP